LDRIKTSPSNHNENSTASDKENDLNSSVDSDTSKRKPLPQTDLCTGDNTTCFVHNYANNTQRQKWRFYHEPTQLDALIASLNERGFREDKLKNVLVTDKEYFTELVAECPAHFLNRTIPDPEVEKRIRESKSTPVKFLRGSYTLRQRGGKEKESWTKRLAALKARR
jgi:hypothetical protein